MFDFEVEHSTEEVVLKGDHSLFLQHIPVPTDTIPDQTWSLDLADEPNAVHVVAMELQLTDTKPSGRWMQIPFSFINNLRFELLSTDPSSDLPPITLAQMGHAPAGHEIPMDVDEDVNILPYIKSGFEVRSVLDARVPAADLSFVGVFTLGVDVF